MNMKGWMNELRLRFAAKGASDMIRASAPIVDQCLLPNEQMPHPIKSSQAILVVRHDRFQRAPKSP